MPFEKFCVKLPDGSNPEVSVKYEILARGTLLYRGSPSRAAAPVAANARWLARTAEDAKIYGYVDAFRTTRELKLLRPDHVLTHAVFDSVYRAWARAKGTRANLFDSVFPTRDEQILRDSEFEADDVVAQALCSAVHGDGARMLPDYAGWSTPRMPTPAANSFHHAEVVLCDPASVLEFVGKAELVYSPRTLQKFRYQSMVKAAAAAAAPKKPKAKGRRRADANGGPSSRKLF